MIQTERAIQNPPSSSTTFCTYYGPGELEMYRHQQLYQSVKDAKLKVFYPGQWGRPSPRACFLIPLVYEWSKEPLSMPNNGDDDRFVFMAGDCGMIRILSNRISSDGTYGIRFRSNARIVSAAWIEFSDGDAENKSDDGMKIHPDNHGKANSTRLDWKSSMTTTQGDRFYDHVLLIPPDNVHNFYRDECHIERTVVSSLEVELDSRQQEPSTLVESNGERIVESLGSSESGRDKEENKSKIWEVEICEGDGAVDKALTMPPCITFEVFFPDRGDGDLHKNSIGHTETIPPKLIFDWKQHRHHAVSAKTWKWRKVKGVRKESNNDANETNCHANNDWLTILTFWAIEKKRRHSLELSTGEAFNHWKFPHQIELSKIATVDPVSVEHISNRCENNMNSTENQCCSLLYDFGKEMFGKVVISIPPSPTCSSSMDESSFLPHVLSVKLWVGESLAEALNDEVEHFEQSLDLSYSLETHGLPFTKSTTVHDDSSQKSLRHCWKSDHLLAFRYVRILIDYDHEYVDLSSQSTHTSPDSWRSVCQNPAVHCESHMAHLELRCSFKCSESRINKIWNCATQTLQLCTLHNFLVDGIKRDRLPWAGDLAVSLLANAYTFRDPLPIEWSLTILGRCGMDHVAHASSLNHIDDKCSVANARKIMSASHINGIVDYSMWFVICHSLYQQHFGNTSFLLQEWKWIELRVKSIVAFCSNQEEGWFLSNEEDWLFIDWTDDVKRSSALQVLWWWALDCAISLSQKMESIAYHDSLHDFTSVLIDLQAKLMSSFLAQGDIQGSFSRHAHILGLVSGLYCCLEGVASDCNWNDPNIDHERSAALFQCRQLKKKSRDSLLGDELCDVGTPYMKILECLALSRVGERVSALGRLERYWYEMIRCGATTFYEAFNENESPDDVMGFYGRPFARSLCHAWGAGPSSCLPEICFGLRPLSEGWTVWRCDPLTSISSGSTTLETDHGKIIVELDATEIRVSVPPGTEMILMDKIYNSGEYCIPRRNIISEENIRLWSEKFRGWHYNVLTNHVIPPNPEILAYKGLDITMTDVPTVFQLPGKNDSFFMSFVGFDGDGYQSFIAESNDLLHWENIRLAMSYGEAGSFDHGGVVLGAYLYENYDISAPRVLKRVDGKFFSLYGAYAKKGTYEPDPGFQGLASSEDGLVWKREIDESILSIFRPGVVGKWEKDSIYQPWLLEHNSLYYNFYNAKEMPQWVEQIGLASSSNLKVWRRYDKNPVVSVKKTYECTKNEFIYDSQFTSDAKVFWDPGENENDGHWVMFFFGISASAHWMAHIMIAFSKDLINWVTDPIPLYFAGGNPNGLDKQHAHKISLVWNSQNDTWYLFYCAVGDAGRGIGLITSQPL